MPELHLLRDVIVLFALGVVVVVAVHRLRVPSIVGFLITGVLSGPYGFGLISAVSEVEALAELGIVLLLFTVGIEFSIQQLLRIKRFLVVGGTLQVGLTIVFTLVLVRAIGTPWHRGVFLGMLVALSSTAIVLRLFSERGEMDSPFARVALGILIFQDLCIVPMVLLTPFLGTGAVAGDALRQIAIVGIKAVIFLAAAFVAARYVVPRVLALVVQTRQREAFLLTMIILCVGTAAASASIGLSLALGAFIAGLIVSASEYSPQALSEMLPLREVFNSLFFISMGMLFDVRTLLASPLIIGAALTAVIVLKSGVTTAVTLALGHPLRTSLLAGFALAQIGEFSFVLASVGVQNGLLDRDLNQLFLAIAVGSMAVTPALHAVAPHVAQWCERRLPSRLLRGWRPAGTETLTLPMLADHVVVIGYGLNGRNLCRVLTHHAIPFAVIELNPETVRRERERGLPMQYGDATRQEILQHAGIARARMAVIAISDPAATRSCVAAIRRLNDQANIIVRTRYTVEADVLFALGATDVVTEEFETSIEIFSRVLRHYFVSVDDIERLVLEIRMDRYEMLRSLRRGTTPAAGLGSMLADFSIEVFHAETGCEVAGQTLREARLRERAGTTVVALRRLSGETLANPSGRDIIHAGDTVLAMGRPAELLAARVHFRAPSS
jgi:CPA2 family monovalent cation:H+ antiporter-2